MPPAAKRLYYIGGILLVIAGLLALIYVAKLMFFTTQTIKDLGGSYSKRSHHPKPFRPSRVDPGSRDIGAKMRLDASKFTLLPICRVCEK